MERTNFKNKKNKGYGKENNGKTSIEVDGKRTE